MSSGMMTVGTACGAKAFFRFGFGMSGRGFVGGGPDGGGTGFGALSFSRSSREVGTSEHIAVTEDMARDLKLVWYLASFVATDVGTWLQIR